MVNSPQFPQIIEIFVILPFNKVDNGVDGEDLVEKKRRY